MPVLYNEHQFQQEDDLRVSSPASAKSQYCILRGKPIDYAQYDRFLHALKRNGYYRVFQGSLSTRNPRWCSGGHFGQSGNIGKAFSCGYQPMRFYPRTKDQTTYRLNDWPSDRWEYKPDSAGPFIVRDDSGVFRDEGGSPRKFLGPVSDDTMDGILMEFSGMSPKDFEGSRRIAPIWFQEYIPIKIEGAKVEWRVYYFEGEAFYLCPKHRVEDVQSVLRMFNRSEGLLGN